MSTANIVGGTSDGLLSKWGSTWAACLAASPIPSTAATSYDAVQRYGNGSNTYQLARAFLCFDLSPYAGATITAATLNVYISSTLRPTFMAYYLDWATGGLTAADWATGTAASASVTPPAAGAMTAITLTNLSSLLPANGGLFLALDDETTGPGTSNYQANVTFADSATNKPNLDITYSTGSQLTLATTAITAITTTTATGGGTLRNPDALAITDRGVCWNTGGAPTIADSHTSD